jgi:hypothetical protein
LRTLKSSAALARVLLILGGVPTLTELPDDPALLKQLLLEREAQIAQRDAAIEQIKQEAAAQLEAQRQKHEAEVMALLRRFYGPKSERFDPRQLLLFGLVMDSLPVDTTGGPSCPRLCRASPSNMT